MNRPLLVIVISLFLYSQIQAQVSADIRLEQSSQSDKRLCYNIDVRQTTSNDAIMLAGQNFRLFYSSGSLELNESSWKMSLSEDGYTSNLVQHRKNVDASKVGVLDFDKDLGFINATIILNGTNSRGEMLQKNQWVTLSEMCFDIENDELSKRIVLARPDLTSGYGRAFMELSYVDVDGSIQSINIRNTEDIQLP